MQCIMPKPSLTKLGRLERCIDLRVVWNMIDLFISSRWGRMAEQVTCWGTALPPFTVDMSRRMGTPSPLPPNSLKYHRKQSSCGQTSLSCQQAIGFVKKKSSQARQTLSAFFLQRQLCQPFFSCSGCARVAQALKKPKQQVCSLTQFFSVSFL